jgi:cobalt/nickel transport system permease protein
MAIYVFIKKVSPGTIYEGAKQKTKAIYGLVVALICMTPIGLLATGTAWGEWGVDEIKDVVSGGAALGYVPTGMKNGFSLKAIMPDYGISGLPDAAGYVLSAVAGVAIMLILFKVISSFMKNKAESISG